MGRWIAAARGERTRNVIHGHTERVRQEDLRWRRRLRPELTVVGDHSDDWKRVIGCPKSTRACEDRRTVMRWPSGLPLGHNCFARFCVITNPAGDRMSSSVKPARDDGDASHAKVVGRDWMVARLER
jgi:hypothetical protein